MKPGRLQKNMRGITPGNSRPAVPVSFSFRHIARNHTTFSYSSCNADYFCKVFERLSALSGLTMIELIANRTSSLRVHPIAWDETTEPEGFDFLSEQLRASVPYQFAISANAHGRIHGFFIDNVFYIVWMDPRHALYARR